jgi:DNA replication factor GINS
VSFENVPNYYGKYLEGHLGVFMYTSSLTIIVLPKDITDYKALYLKMVTDRLTSSIFEDIHSIYDLAYLMEEVRIMYKQDVKVSNDNIQIDAKEGDISSIRRWIAKILSQHKLVEIQDSEISSYVSRALNRERIARPHDLSKIDIDFYVRVDDYLSGLKERDRENLMISLNSFVAARLEKIVKLAAASPLAAETEEKLSAEESLLYTLVHDSTSLFKQQVLRKNG